MGTQWARQEAKKNELAVWVDKAVAWVKFHPQPAVWACAGVVFVILLAAGFAHRQSVRKEEAWARLAMVQSYAYAGQPDNALQQAKALGEEHSSSAAADFARLLSGDMLFEQGKYKEAAQAYEQALQRPAAKGSAPMALASLGLTQEAGGDCKAAAATDQKFLDSYADHYLAPPVHASLARCLAAMGERDKAKATFERIAFLYPQTYWADWAKAHNKS